MAHYPGFSGKGGPDANPSSGREPIPTDRLRLEKLASRREGCKDARTRSIGLNILHRLNWVIYGVELGTLRVPYILRAGQKNRLRRVRNDLRTLPFSTVGKELESVTRSFAELYQVSNTLGIAL
ncbi:hypothetical protein CIHG_01765 [Coccidioides immitis H538.4]|uniref:Uncharacterized protein n=3 Tax=Coccidioides immitis TaxID=5501 RepID=A0A0J8U1P6_COCIT|nr:hypothetical protein CIRG_06090 [Coccidioides immitis RMSCC 2394]KMU80387.1 hypothetical protein CISG_02237 [Coccidioides immitis RMSCC 3703]KMU83980.1 hypothetical protein CIHG_01765 [Coccidioides immitis H538.4]